MPWFLPGVGEDGASPAAREFSFAVHRTRALNGTLSRGEMGHLLATYGSAETARTHVIVALRVGGRDRQRVRRHHPAPAATITMSPPPTCPHHATQLGAITVVRTTKVADEGAGATSYATPSSRDRPGASGDRTLMATHRYVVLGEPQDDVAVGGHQGSVTGSAGSLSLDGVA